MYALSVWLHVVAATAWVGSMIFFAAVVVPVVRRAEGAPQLVLALGRRFRVLGWLSLGVLLATGATNLAFRGIGWALLADRAFWSTAFGRALAYKLALVTFVLAATAAHDRWSGGSRRAASWLGRLVLLASLAILYFATALVRGFF
jgi:putative copper export protein